MAVVFSGARVWVGGLCLVVMAGCGGRTSMFTPDDDPGFGSSVAAGGSTASGASTSTAPHPTPSGGASSVSPAGGAPGVSTSTGVAGGVATGGSAGIAGAPSTGTGGSAGTTAGDACANFCLQASKFNCGVQFGQYAECVSSCTGELGASALCLQLGEAVINCYLPLIEGAGGRCSDIDNEAEVKCAQQFDQFQRCSDSTPTPTPVPIPIPIPPPAANCNSQGSSSGVSCNLTSKCADGTYYTVNCNQASPNETFCTCQTGNASGAGTGAGFTLNESVAFACYDGISTCGGPIPTLPR